jgi:hypothetical protein
MRMYIENICNPGILSHIYEQACLKLPSTEQRDSFSKQQIMLIIYTSQTAKFLVLEKNYIANILSRFAANTERTEVSVSPGYSIMTNYAQRTFKFCHTIGTPII